MLSKEELIARLRLIQTQFDTAPISKYIATLEQQLGAADELAEHAACYKSPALEYHVKKFQALRGNVKPTDDSCDLWLPNIATLERKIKVASELLLASNPEGAYKILTGKRLV